MNAADELLIQAIRTKPWRELSLCGASIVERMRPGPKRTKIRVLDTRLAWVEQGQVFDEFHEELVLEELRAAAVHDLLKEIAAFARGSIPVAWGAQSRALLHAGLDLVDFDPSLCFLLRKQSRWLDPSIWCRVRTGKLLTMEAVLDAVGLVKSQSPAIDVAALAFALPMRPGFPVKPEWTASETAEWQELQEAF